jgi:hypothetical protein
MALVAYRPDGEFGETLCKILMRLRPGGMNLRLRIIQWNIRITVWLFVEHRVDACQRTCMEHGLNLRRIATKKM